MRAGITAGRSVRPVKDKNDEDQCFDACNEYLEIVTRLQPEHVRIYTDGSHNPDDRTTGYGVRIVHHSRGIEKVLHTVSKGLGSATVNEAELAAVHDALTWLFHENKQILPPVHIFTDSKYTFKHLAGSAEE